MLSKHQNPLSARIRITDNSPNRRKISGKEKRWQTRLNRILCSLKS